MVPKQVVFLILFIDVKIIFGDSKYRGENFPKRYLEPDKDIPVEADLGNYVNGLLQIIGNLMDNINGTDVNEVMATYLAGVVVKRTLQDYHHKLKEDIKTHLKMYSRHADKVVSYFVYRHRGQPWSSVGFRISRILKDDTPHVFAIRDFRKNALSEWLFSEEHISEFVPNYDNLNLPKEKYVELVEAINVYDIKVNDSDYCLAMLSENIDPIDVTKLRRCNDQSICKQKVFTSPSVAYTLSHRLLNNLLYMFNRRCYMHSPKIDNSHMDMLCAAMYREVVYIARRGYFYRDLFLEHIGLCGHLGYEEFHRRHWFRKVRSWINEQGCFQEFPNFEINRTRLIIEETDDPLEKKRLRKKLKLLLIDNCHTHQMVVAMMVLANGIRHAAHFMQETKKGI